MPLPTFFVIGAPKAGTTSLHSYLGQHPEVQMSAVKEPRHFAGPADGIPFPADHVADRGEYEAMFDAAVPVRGESSTDYATFPRRKGVPERIKFEIPDAKFIYAVRDPIARTVSHYKMGVALLGENRPIGEALADLSDFYSPYIAGSLYAKQLQLYIDVFPRDRILVIDQSDLLNDREATLRRVFTFLGVDPDAGRIAADEELLTSEQWRNYPAGYADFIARAVAPHFRWIPTGFRRNVRAAIERRLWPSIETELEDPLRRDLEKLLRPEAERLRELTGKDFAGWSV
jgi:hypothetical protein